MNKQVFIERLNLYLDEELSPDEAEELLEAIRQNPEYHRIYVQYCQLFNACSQLGGAFAEPKAANSWRQKVYAIGGMAAAGALLFMAARNLSPLIGDNVDQSAQIEPAAGSFAGVETEPLLVMDVNELNGQELRFGEGLMPVSFNVEKAFDRGDEPLNFGSDSDVSFVRFAADQSTVTDQVWTKKEFKFGEPVAASTFEHEALSSGERDERIFSVRAISEAFDEESAVDFGRAALTVKKASR